jgi:hypothetical protein
MNEARRTSVKTKMLQTPAASPKTEPHGRRPLRSPIRDHGCWVLVTSRSVPDQRMPPAGGRCQPCLLVTIFRVCSSCRGQIANQYEELGSRLGTSNGELDNAHSDATPFRLIRLLLKFCLLSLRTYYPWLPPGNLRGKCLFVRAIAKRWNGMKCRRGAGLIPQNQPVARC